MSLPYERLLLVAPAKDDLRLLREALKGVRSSAYMVERIAHSGEALARMAAGHFDLVVLGPSLHRESVMELLREALEKAPDAPILLLTEAEESDFEAAARRVGVADIIYRDRLSPAVF